MGGRRRNIHRPRLCPEFRGIIRGPGFHNTHTKLVEWVFGIIRDEALPNGEPIVRRTGPSPFDIIRQKREAARRAASDEALYDVSNTLTTVSSSNNALPVLPAKPPTSKSKKTHVNANKDNYEREEEGGDGSDADGEKNEEEEEEDDEDDEGDNTDNNNNSEGADQGDED